MRPTTRRSRSTSNTSTIIDNQHSSSRQASIVAGWMRGSATTFALGSARSPQWCFKTYPQRRRELHHDHPLGIYQQDQDWCVLDLHGARWLVVPLRGHCRLGCAGRNRVRALGYPAHFVAILGVWKVLGACAILVPRLPRLKEWAYAGMIFDLTGGAIAHASVGDGDAWMGNVGHIVTPLVIASFVAASWALRPKDRKGEHEDDPKMTRGTLLPSS